MTETRKIQMSGFFFFLGGGGLNSEGEIICVGNLNLDTHHSLRSDSPLSHAREQRAKRSGGKESDEEVRTISPTLVLQRKPARRLHLPQSECLE